MKRFVAIAGPFVLALSPLLIAFGVRRVSSGTETTATWPGVVAVMTAAEPGQLDSLAVLGPRESRLTTFPTDLVLTPPDHGEVRALTLFANGKLEAIRAGLEVTLGQAVPFYLLRDGFGTVTAHNLGENLDDAEALITSSAPVEGRVRRVNRPDGIYSYLLANTSVNAPGSLPQIDPRRVTVTIAFGAAAEADAQLVATRLREAGYRIVAQIPHTLTREPGAEFQYRLDPFLAEAAAATADIEAAVAPIGDLALARYADVLVLLT